MRRRLTAAVLCLMLAGPALAQTAAPPPQPRRSAGEQQLLLDLSRTLGEAHALRQICRDRNDQFWRDQMIALIETEQPPFEFQSRLQGAFNAGYATRQAQFPNCDGAARLAEDQVAAEGQMLARRLSASQNR